MSFRVGTALDPCRIRAETPLRLRAHALGGPTGTPVPADGYRPDVSRETSGRTNTQAPRPSGALHPSAHMAARPRAGFVLDPCWTRAGSVSARCRTRVRPFVLPCWKAPVAQPCRSGVGAASEPCGISRAAVSERCRSGVGNGFSRVGAPRGGVARRFVHAPLPRRRRNGLWRRRMFHVKHPHAAKKAHRLALCDNGSERETAEPGARRATPGASGS